MGQRPTHGCCAPSLAPGTGRRLDRGEVATLKDIADNEGVTVPVISRFLRLAYLSPEVLERLLIHRWPCALPLDKLAATALVPWSEQLNTVFDE
jgi:hypothetical protein